MHILSWLLPQASEIYHSGLPAGLPEPAAPVPVAPGPRARRDLPKQPKGEKSFTMFFQWGNMKFQNT